MCKSNAKIYNKNIETLDNIDNHIKSQLKDFNKKLTPMKYIKMSYNIVNLSSLPIVNAEQSRGNNKLIEREREIENMH